MDVPDPELAAMAFATQYLVNRGYEVRNVSRDRRHKGYDLLASGGDEDLTIEVKGCTRAWGIPDPYFTEFDADRRLVADFLYVVYFLPDQPRPQLCIIPRAAIAPAMVRPKQGYRISGKFKKAEVMRRFLVAVEDSSDET